jgi:hypothetical protein
LEAHRGKDGSDPPVRRAVARFPIPAIDALSRPIADAGGTGFPRPYNMTHSHAYWSHCDEGFFVLQRIGPSETSEPLCP